MFTWYSVILIDLLIVLFACISLWIFWRHGQGHLAERKRTFLLICQQKQSPKAQGAHCPQPSTGLTLLAVFSSQVEYLYGCNVMDQGSSPPPVISCHKAIKCIIHIWFY
jgi:hypothetical protein